MKNGGAHGGTPGDQNGTQIGQIQNYYNCPDCVLRYNEDSTSTDPEPQPTTEMPKSAKVRVMLMGSQYWHLHYWKRDAAKWQQLLKFFRQL